MEHLIVLVYDIIERGFVSPEMYSPDMSGSKTDEGETIEVPVVVLNRGKVGEGFVPVLHQSKGILHEKHFVIITSSGFCVDLSIHVHLGYPGAQYHEREHHLHVTCEKHETHGRFQ